MRKRKKFDQKLHDEYDLDARWMLMYYFQSIGAEVEEDPLGEWGLGDKGIDLRVVLKDGRVIYIDVEVRPGWRRGDFPFDTIHVPERKRKFLSDSLDVYFISLRKDLAVALAVAGNKLCDEMLTEVSNKYIESGEYFYDVPVEETKFLDLSLQTGGRDQGENQRF